MCFVSVRLCFCACVCVFVSVSVFVPVSNVYAMAPGEEGKLQAVRSGHQFSLAWSFYLCVYVSVLGLLAV